MRSRTRQHPAALLHCGDCRGRVCGAGICAACDCVSRDAHASSSHTTETTRNGYIILKNSQRNKLAREFC